MVAACRAEIPVSPTQDGSKEVAVKVVNKDFFKQDPKVRENLEREIRIMKLLRGCEYVVHLFHVQVRGWPTWEWNWRVFSMTMIPWYSSLVE